LLFASEGLGLSRPHSFKLDYAFIAFLILGICAIYAQIFQGLYLDWLNDENYSHGFLVPVISGYFIWQNREELAELSTRPANSGLFIILFSLAVLFVGVAAQEHYSMRSSFIFLLAGIIVFLLGWQWLKSLTLPVGFLFFMIPLPYIIYDAISFPLKLFVTKFSVISLKLMGVVVLREGNIIMFPQTVLEVADACSGLRSLMSLLALGVALAVFSQQKISRRVLLVVFTVPIAVATNMLRVIGTGFLAQHYGAAAAEGFFHEFAGMAVFVLAMVLLFATSGVLRKIWP
jgi:exosortase